MIKSTGIDFFTFYATTGAVKCNHQLVVATTGAFTLTSVILTLDPSMCHALVVRSVNAFGGPLFYFAEAFDETSFGIILSRECITKTLIRVRG